MASEVVEGLNDYLVEMDNISGWSRLFDNLYGEALRNRSSTTAAKHPDNKNKNRYRDVLPADDTRFKLEEGDDDYINANYVKVPDVSRSFILTQGPLPYTAEHFWQMIWEEKSRGICMLNHVIEKNTRKCHQYWPAKGITEPSLIFGQFCITAGESDRHSTFTINHLILEKLESEEEPREILHFHYTDWPDFGVPRTGKSFLDYLWAVRDSGCLDEGVGSLVVHCSAGIGRSGTFCLVDVCLKQIELVNCLEGPDIEAHLLAMRKQRFGLIQTPDQLRFAYMAIAEGIDRVAIVPVNGTEEPGVEAEEVAEEETEDEELSEKASEKEESKLEDAEVEEAPAKDVEKPSQLDLPPEEVPLVSTTQMSPTKRPRTVEDDNEDTPPPRKREAPLNGSGPAAATSSGQDEALPLSRAQSGLGAGRDDDILQSSDSTREKTEPANGPRERRRQQQKELASKVETIQEKMRRQEEERGKGRSWSSYIVLPLAAVAFIGGAYAVYRFLS